MFKLKIITPKGVYLDKEIESLTIKLTTGYRTILSGHAPLIGSVDYGPMHLIINGETKYYAVMGGALSIDDSGSVSLIINGINTKEEIDLERALQSKERAEHRLKEKDDNTDLRRAELSLKRAISRIDTYNS